VDLEWMKLPGPSYLIFGMQMIESGSGPPNGVTLPHPELWAG
jgi:hypothetical protein